MTEKEQQHLLTYVYNGDIDIIFAKTLQDMKRPGLHLAEPTKELLFKAIQSSLELQITTIVIHTKLYKLK